MLSVGDDDAGPAAGGIDHVAGIGKNPDIAQLVQDVPDRTVALVGAQVGIKEFFPPVQADGGNELPGAAECLLAFDILDGNGGDFSPAERFNHKIKATKVKG